MLRLRATFAKANNGAYRTRRLEVPLGDQRFLGELSQSDVSVAMRTGEALDLAHPPRIRIVVDPVLGHAARLGTLLVVGERMHQNRMALGRVRAVREAPVPLALVGWRADAFPHGIQFARLSSHDRRALAESLRALAPPDPAKQRRQ